ncbi:MAG: hypothetical protein PVF33_05260 [Candidatus Latescibacterota bacterium]|jgi:hypothetical protein
MMAGVLKKISVPLAVWVMLTLAPDAAVAGFSLGGAFKSPGYGARAWGMGGAAVATVNDEGSVYWNPGMMALAPTNAIGAAYINLVPGTTARQSQLAYVHVFNRHDTGPDGISVGYHAVGVMYTNLRLGVQSGENYDENTVRLAYSYTPDPLVSFAIAWDLFASSSGVDGFDSRGTSVDGALRLSMTEHVVVGLVARNAFSRYSYDDGTDYRREREYVLAVSSRSIPYFAIEGDMVYAHGGTSRWIVGAETDYMFGVLALRAGVAAISAGESRTVPYYGMSVGASRLFIHYNVNMDTESAFADTHRFTVSFSL